MYNVVDANLVMKCIQLDIYIFTAAHVAVDDPTTILIMHPSHLAKGISL